jgi:hypothetical protein
MRICNASKLVDITQIRVGFAHRFREQFSRSAGNFFLLTVVEFRKYRPFNILSMGILANFAINFLFFAL